ncbi:MAG: hypothetical protein Q8M01_04140 [Rubrivivax sp.]|nr:hypothetical protein [Rubrivivax sp.]
MTIRSCGPQGRHRVSVQAHIAQRCEGAPAPGRNQNRMHVQKALMEYLLLGRIG